MWETESKTEVAIIREHPVRLEMICFAALLIIYSLHTYAPLIAIFAQAAFKHPGRKSLPTETIIMPPKFGPLTAQQEKQRVQQARVADTKLREAVETAVRGGAQPTTFSGKQRRSLQIGGRRKK